MKVHTSNYKVTGFTSEVNEAAIAKIAHVHDLPFIVDLGAGSLIDLTAYGLPKEPIVREIIEAGADIITFSADKLLGGPQAGLIVGKKALINKIKRHPLKRALRVSKITLAALEATLMAYRKPDHLRRDLPTLWTLTRPLDEIKILAERLLPYFEKALGKDWHIEIKSALSQVGSGSLPADVIPSYALSIAPLKGKQGPSLKRLSESFRRLPIPVIGRISEDSLILDLRCLRDEQILLDQLTHFHL
jgi:L-seryl-tRNA(Ser) seleniumtransferase